MKNQYLKFKNNSFYYILLLISGLFLFYSCGSDSQEGNVDLSPDFTINNIDVLTYNDDYTTIPNNPEDDKKVVPVELDSEVFFQTTTKPSKNVKSVKWDFDDDYEEGGWDATDKKVKYKFEEEGMYKVTMQINDEYIISKYVHVREKETPDNTDTDKDGFVDADDDCPKIAGSLYGCPDKDKDNIPDKDDKCPGVAGLLIQNGCPDTDNDGIIDSKDNCPEKFGPKSNKGCPVPVAAPTPVPDPPESIESPTTTTKSAPTIVPPPTPTIIDTDKDGVADKDDKCPNIAGRFNGCPDGDGDGVTDNLDDCPNEIGLSKLNGCPDRDNDGVADKDDDCPNQKGDISDKGCPKDSDKDGIIDDKDPCPNVAGTVNGCPDRDRDGVADKEDKCPDEKGLKSYNGCPKPKLKDTDGDGITDDQDKCPDKKGLKKHDGCPPPCPQKGTLCDDGDPCTEKDKEDGNCNCAGTFKDSDGDEICDSLDKCPQEKGTQECAGCPSPCNCPSSGKPCDDGDPCTEKDKEDGNCNCAGTFKDSDGDEICDAEDRCPDKKGTIKNNGCPEDCTKTIGTSIAKAGIGQKDRKEDCKIYTNESISIKLTPSQCVELETAYVYTDNCGTLSITLSSSKGTERMNVPLVKGKSPIDFTDMETLLESGITYTLTLSPASGNSFCTSSNTPQLENISACSPNNNNSTQLDISYNGNMVLFDLKYLY